MTRIVPLGFLARVAATLPLLLLAHCGGSGCDGDGIFSDGCGPPIYGYAEVEGDALQADGTPIAGRDAFVSCGDAGGTYSDRTDSEGRFRVALVYAVFDTLLYPFPPREPDGAFSVQCQASLALAAGEILHEDSLAVRFAPERAGVVPTTVELREIAP